MKKLATVFILIIALALSGCGVSGGNEAPISRDGFYFDTVISVYIYGQSEEDAEKALDVCFDIAEKYEKLFSNTVYNSDIGKINGNAGQPVKVDPDTADVIKTGIRYGDISGGLFDISMGKVSELWDFTGDPIVPTRQEIMELLPYVGYDKIEVTENDEVMVSEGAMLDLGAIAKGYIADRMKEALRDMGVDSAIISLGGNVDLIGKKPTGDNFRVGIQDPFEQDGTAIISIEASDVSVVTSGTYQRYFEQDGVRYHHILSPLTGYPADTGLSSVTIISKSSTDCDALSTTCFLMGAKKGMELIESLPDTEAVFVLSDKTLVFSSGMGSIYPYTKA